jgi:uncharacterized protein
MTTPNYDAVFDATTAVIRQLPGSFTYHNLQHTLSVVQESEHIALQEGIADAHSLLLLRTAALLHDIGFSQTYQYHESAGCAWSLPLLAQHGYKGSDILSIHRMIMATEIPQTPYNKLSQILCDADLDYLGRADFFEVAQTLKTEWMNHQVILTEAEWDTKQVAFLKHHRYFTAFAQQARQPVKQSYLRRLLAA